MKIISSYGIEIKHMNRIFMYTVAVYNYAISFCIDAFENEWSDIEGLDTMQRKQYAESLIHSTRNNTAKYGNFDTLFHKMPSYMRRAVIFLPTVRLPTIFPRATPIAPMSAEAPPPPGTGSFEESMSVNSSHVSFLKSIIDSCIINYLFTMTLPYAKA